MSKRDADRAQFVFYLAVLPFYRSACIQIVSDELGSDMRAFAGRRHIDPTVTTGIPSSLYRRVRNVVLGGRLLIQLGHWREVLSAHVAILDLNPRSLSAWLLLLMRNVLHRRTLLWGHLDPRGGSKSRTKRLRNFMRGLAQGTVLYGYEGVASAQQDFPSIPVWVAPNSLYRASEIRPALPVNDRPNFIYAGRLVREKKVDLLVRAASEPRARDLGITVTIVGEGSDLVRLQSLAAELGVAERVGFLGKIVDPRDLLELYAGAVAAISPGYAGLNLTQSLGFGVPILVAKNEPHAPEIELAALGSVRFFESDDPTSLAEAMATEYEERDRQGRAEVSALVRASYSAEAMADGIVRAFQNRPQALKEIAWLN